MRLEKTVTSKRHGSNLLALEADCYQAIDERSHDLRPTSRAFPFETSCNDDKETFTASAADREGGRFRSYEG